METLLSSIHEAMKDGASPEARCSGIAACKTILAALETSPGQPMAGGTPGTAGPAQPSAGYQPFSSTPQASVSPLDMVIAQLVAKLGSQNQNEPSETAPKPASGLRIPFVPMASPFKKGA